MSARPASLRRSLALQVLLPRAGLILAWWAANQLLKLPAALAYVLMAADGLFFLWQCRAFQRGADDCIRSTGNLAPVWGGYLGLLLAGFATVTLWWEALLIARHAEQPPYALERAKERESRYRLAVSADGTALVFAGEITHGLTRRVKDQLAATPGITLVVLSGPGGLIYEARGVAQVIRAHGLDTEARGLCASACTLVFAAGRSRRLGAGGQLGFHGYALMVPGGLPQVDLPKEQERDLQFLQQQGISEEFARRALAARHTDLWIPAVPELQAAGVLTGSGS